MVNAYETVTPEFARTGISNFVTNIGEIITFANEVLQFKFKEAGMTAFRFTANMLVGFFGFFDVTSHEGIPRTNEDFGQTLGVWGAGEGPYLDDRRRDLLVENARHLRDGEPLINVVDKASWF